MVSVSNCAPQGSRVILLSRTSLLAATQWYVRQHVGLPKGLYRFGSIEYVTTYFLLRLYIGISLVYTGYKNELGVVEAEFYWQSSSAWLLREG